jgi:hypothetical protein
LKINGDAEGPSRPRSRAAQGWVSGLLSRRPERRETAAARVRRRRSGGAWLLRWRRSSGAAAATVEEEERRSGYGGRGAVHGGCADKELDGGGLGQGSDGVR